MSITSVMVIGGARYIGTELVRSLATRQGCRVTAVDLCWFGSALANGVDLWRMDAWDLTMDAIADYHVVVFLAGLSNDPMAEFSSRRNFVENAALPAFLGFFNKQAGLKKFIFAGSCSVYGHSKDHIMCEDDLAQPGFPYGLAKLQAESIPALLASEHFSVHCLRLGTVGGWSGRPRLDIVLKTMVRDALLARRIAVRGPSVWRPIIRLHDTECVYTQFIVVQLTSGIYNVAQGNYRLHELGQYVYNVMHERGWKVEFVIEGAQYPRNYYVKLKKLQRTVRILPQQTPDCIVAELFENMSHLDPTLLSTDRFYNINVFRQIERELQRVSRPVTQGVAICPQRSSSWP